MAATNIDAVVCGAMGCRSSAGLARVEIDGRGMVVLCTKCQAQQRREER